MVGGLGDDLLMRMYVGDLYWFFGVRNRKNCYDGGELLEVDWNILMLRLLGYVWIGLVTVTLQLVDFWGWLGLSYYLFYFDDYFDDYFGDYFENGFENLYAN